MQVKEFGELKVGETFEYAGQIYRKEKDNVARLIRLDNGEDVYEAVLHRFFPEIEVLAPDDAKKQR